MKNLLILSFIAYSYALIAMEEKTATFPCIITYHLISFSKKPEHPPIIFIGTYKQLKKSTYSKKVFPSKKYTISKTPESVIIETACTAFDIAQHILEQQAHTKAEICIMEETKKNKVFLTLLSTTDSDIIPQEFTYKQSINTKHVLYNQEKKNYLADLKNAQYLLVHTPKTK